MVLSTTGLVKAKPVIKGFEQELTDTSKNSVHGIRTVVIYG